MDSNYENIICFCLAPPPPALIKFLPVYTSVLRPNTSWARRRRTSRASSSWSLRCPGTMRSGTASPSSRPLLFLGTGACTQSQKPHTCAAHVVNGSHINLIGAGKVDVIAHIPSCQSGIFGHRDIVLRLRTGGPLIEECGLVEIVLLAQSQLRWVTHRS